MGPGGDAEELANRSYDQYCPIAHALDVVGDRWALLVVRDLMLGPKRFGDLREGLPGIATNVLADRLKKLEGAGVVARGKLPPPAGSAVYELTPRGRGLQEALVALVRWGGETLGEPRPGQAVSEESVMLALWAVFGPLAAPGVRKAWEVRFEEASFGGTFGVRLDDGAVGVAKGAPEDPDAAMLRVRLEALFAVSSGQESLREAVERGALGFDGPEDAARLLGRAGQEVSGFTSRNAPSVQ